MVDAHYGNQDCATHSDFRNLLARKDIDAVSIATGNRWHAMASMFAAHAGKDIYCEKPISLTIQEGRQLVETARRFGTIYQAGTQRRSTASYRFARDMVRQGDLGRILEAGNLAAVRNQAEAFRRQGRRMPLAFHQFAEGLARHIDVDEQLAAGIAEKIPGTQRNGHRFVGIQ